MSFELSVLEHVNNKFCRPGGFRMTKQPLCTLKTESGHSKFDKLLSAQLKAVIIVCCDDGRP